MRRAMGYKGRDIKSAHTNDADRGIIGRKKQRAAALVKERRLGLDPCRLHKRQSLVENPSLGDCKDDAFSHNARALGAARRKGNMAEALFAPRFHDRQYPYNRFGRQLKNASIAAFTASGRSQMTK